MIKKQTFVNVAGQLSRQSIHLVIERLQVCCGARPQHYNLPGLAQLEKWIDSLTYRPLPTLSRLMTILTFTSSFLPSFFFQSCLRLAQTYFIKYLVEAIATSSTSEGFYWATALSITMVVLWLIHHQYFYRGEMIGNNLKTGIFSLIYQKVPFPYIL